MKPDELEKYVSEKTSLIMQLEAAKRTGSDKITALASEAARLEGVIAQAYLEAERPDKATANLISQASCLVDAGEILSAVSVLESAREVAPTQKLKLWIDREFWKALTSDTAASVIGILQEANRDLRRKVLELELSRTANQRSQNTFSAEGIRQSQNLESIGLTGIGITSGCGVLLSMVHGYTDFLLSQRYRALLANDSKEHLEENLEIIKTASVQSLALTRKLLAVSNKVNAPPKRVNMNEVVEKISILLVRLLGENIKLQVSYFPQLPLLEADEGMIEQVLLNLATNSRDAMPKGGQFTIQVSVRAVDEKHADLHPDAREGHFVCLTVKDTGCGIKSENLPRIFEPFFTTKEPGKGTGLGLSTVFGIVKRHQGWIEVKSSLGRGTTFHVYIPFVEPAQIEAGKPTPRVTGRGGSETILLVKDAHAEREPLASVLKNCGFKILMAHNGHEAVNIWHEHKDKINLLLIDLVMPGDLSGHELAVKLRAESPDLKVIVTSAFGKEILRDDSVDFGSVVLRKPHNSKMLVATIRDCLGR